MKFTLLKPLFPIITFIAIISQNSYADSYVTKFISNVNGLSNNSINCIWEDKEHTMWFGTWGGLNAYNGRDIKTYKYSSNNANSISNNIVRQIVESGDYLWIATDNGINRIDKKTEQIKRYYLRNSPKKVPSAEKSYSIGKSGDGTIFGWFKGKGLFKFRNNRFERIPIDFTCQVKELSITKSGAWFLLNNSVLKYISINANTRYLRERDLKSITVSVSKLFISDKQNIAQVGEKLIMLDKYARIEKTITISRSSQVSQVLLDGGKLYISSIRGGCLCYYLISSKYSSVDYGISTKMSVLTLFIGSQHILWLGTDGKGVAQLYKYTPLFNTILFSFPVRSFCSYHDNQVLVGTKGGGIQLLNTKTGQISLFRNEGSGLISNSVYALRKNGQNDIFIGTDGYGLNILNAKTNQLSKLIIPSTFSQFKSVYNIHFSNHDSTVWLGTAGYGLIKMNIIKKGGNYIVTQFKRYSSSNYSRTLNNDIIYAIASSPNNRYIWFGSRGGGLNRFDTNSSSISKLEDLTSSTLTNDDILCLFQDGRDLWVGTSYGLNRIRLLTSSYQLTKYNNRNLESKTIHGVVKDLLGNIWLSTNQGLFKISKDGRLENYTIKDGLQNDEFSDGAFFKDKKGNLYFGGVNGLNYFNPQHVHLRNFCPRLELRGLRIYDKDINIATFIKEGKLKLKYDERNVTLKFIAKDFINTESCEYAYRIDKTEQWFEMGTDPNLVLQLSIGKHLLEVKCSNGDKVWNNRIYRLQIIVDNPWWFSFWAILCYLLILSIIGIIASFIIRNRIRMSRKLFLADIDKKQDQKIYESKLTFFTNVAHEFSIPLTLIYTPAQYLSEMGGLDNEIKKYVDVIKDNAERMQKLMQELIEFKKSKSSYEPLCPEKIDTKEHILSIIKNYETIQHSNKIEFKYNSQNLSTIISDKSVLSKIVFNLISNAFQHTPQGGYIKMDFYQEESKNSSLHFIVRHSGRGMTEEQINNIFNEYKIFDQVASGNMQVSNGIGINLTKKLIEYLDGSIKIKSQLGEYIEFVVTIPPLDITREDVIKLEPSKGKMQTSENISREKRHPETLIYIIEDEQNLRNLLSNILYDYTIFDFDNANEVLEAIKRNHPDLIITDLHFAESGLDFVYRLKTDFKTSYIPIIGISGKSSVEEQIDAYNKGIDTYLVKPFHPRQILSSIENLLTRQILLKDYFNSSLSSLTIRNGKVMHEEDKEILERVNDFIKEHISDENLSAEMIEQFLGQSKASFYRKFKDLLDKTPSEYIKNVRLEYAAKLLRTTKMTVSEIIYKSGFSNKSYFYREFKGGYGCSPNDFRKI